MVIKQLGKALPFPNIWHWKREKKKKETQSIAAIITIYHHTFVMGFLVVTQMNQSYL